MTGKVELAVRSAIVPGQILRTPTGGATFIVAEYTPDHLVLLLGAGEHRTAVPWQALEGIPALVRGHGNVKIGSVYDTHAEPGTLDEYLKGYVNRATGGWVAVVLEEAGVIEIDRTRPAHIRVSGPWATSGG